MSRQLPTPAAGVLPDKLSQEIDLLTVDRLPAVAPCFRFRHNRRMPEMKAERKPFLEGIFNLLFATPARLPCLDYPPPAATAPDVPARSVPVRRRSATTGSVLLTIVLSPARTLGHRT